MTEMIEQNIVTLYGEKKWKDIVDLSNIPEVEKCRLFWVLPTMYDLSWMKEIIEEHDVKGLASIGCGCGLLEWLFQQYSGLDVIGIELDQSWWCSKYSPQLFLENIIFLNEKKSRNFRLSKKYALLFCYFNNGGAFCDYIENYEGNLIFVIGPMDGQNRWTDPLPFDRKFEKYGWTLINKKQIGRSKDCIAVYSR